MVNIRALAGQVDFTRESPDVQQLPVYKEQEEAGNFTAGIYSSHVAPMQLNINFISNNEAWNEVVNDIRFRQAMNYAIDRDEVIQTFYFGLAEKAPWNPTEYSVEKANALLDEMGMTERDANGFRMTPSGKELKIIITTAKYLAEHVSIGEVTVEYFAEIGLNSVLEVISADLANERSAANDIMRAIGWSVAPMWPNGTWNDWTPGCPEWDRWMNETDELEGVEPPAAAQRLWEIRDDRAAAVTGGAEDIALYEETVQNYMENLWKIIYVKGINPLIISNDLHNIPTSGQAIAANYSMEQFWLTRGE
jgi:peptide/nickel transport system substrate-binding protein